MENISQKPERRARSVFGFSPNVVAFLCYAGHFTCVLGIIFSVMVMARDKTNELPRFHAIQSIFFAFFAFILMIMVTVVTRLAGHLLGEISGALNILTAVTLSSAAIFLAVTALMGRSYEIPVIGEIAASLSE